MPLVSRVRQVPYWGNSIQGQGNRFPCFIGVSERLEQDFDLFLRSVYNTHIRNRLSIWSMLTFRLKRSQSPFTESVA